MDDFLKELIAAGITEHKKKILLEKLDKLEKTVMQALADASHKAYEDGYRKGYSDGYLDGRRF